MPRFWPRSPTQAHPSSPVSGLILVTVPGRQQEIRRINIFSRFGLESALNISAILAIFLSREFDIYRNIIDHKFPVKKFFLFSVVSAASFLNSLAGNPRLYAKGKGFSQNLAEKAPGRYGHAAVRADHADKIKPIWP
jgi:hypothetical protein